MKTGQSTDEGGGRAVGENRRTGSVYFSPRHQKIKRRVTSVGGEGLDPKKGCAKTDGFKLRHFMNWHARVGERLIKRDT